MPRSNLAGMHGADELKATMPVDRETTVPLDIYQEFQRAGERARNRGLHTLKETYDGDDGVWKQHLVHHPEGLPEAASYRAKQRLRLQRILGCTNTALWSP
eukprot:NODE_21282_length_761_cov_1.553628.p3 GENE.NODE_21282_length_761_cov_1.553628~~NODE_21282_length_761_cov_1.553628.p3  ORF type:complete len:101 (+),score=31.44 NODE_21282_length_761_cov_1.553628:89-391(+)